MKKYLAITLIFFLGLLAGVCLRHQERIVMALELAPVSGGDVNGDGMVNITDAVYLLNFLFTGGEVPNCLAACDTDGDGRAMLTDSVQLLQFLFLGGIPPVNWDGPNPTCETFEPGIPSFGLGCEEANPSCSQPGRVN